MFSIIQFFTNFVKSFAVADSGVKKAEINNITINKNSKEMHFNSDDSADGLKGFSQYHG